MGGIFDPAIFDPAIFDAGTIVTSVTVFPPSFSLTTAGATLALTATAHNSDGSATDVTATATWSSSNPSIATVSSTGLVTAVTEGAVTITATDTVSGTTIGTVAFATSGPQAVDYWANAIMRLCEQFRFTVGAP